MSNRNTVKSNIITKNVPTVTNAILTDMLNSEMADNLKFREDVATVQVAVTSNITCDFTGKDRIDLTRTGGSLNITVAGIGDGETVSLLITKTANQAIAWTNVTDVTPVKLYVAALSVVLYEITRKGAYYFARAWVETVKAATDSINGVIELATQAECNALSDVTRAVTPGRIPIATISQRGVVELADQTEANAFSDLTKALTPGRVPGATNAQLGVIRFSTDAEYLASSATTCPNSAQVKADINAINAFPKIIQKGTYNVGDIGSSVTDIVITISDMTAYGLDYKVMYSIFDANYPQDIRHGIIAKTATTFTIRMYEAVSHVQNIYIDWVIIY